MAAGKFQTGPCLNSHINQNLKAVKSAVCQLWSMLATVIRRTWLRVERFEISVCLCVCIKLMCCSLVSQLHAVRCTCTCVGVCLCVCVLRLPKKGAWAECVVQTTQHPRAHLCTDKHSCNRANPFPSWPSLPCQTWRNTTLWLTGERRCRGSKETKREILTTEDQKHNHFSHPLKAAESYRQALILTFVIQLSQHNKYKNWHVRHKVLQAVICTV